MKKADKTDKKEAKPSDKVADMKPEKDPKAGSGEATGKRQHKPLRFRAYSDQ